MAEPDRFERLAGCRSHTYLISIDYTTTPVLDLPSILDHSIFIAKSSSTPAFHELPSIRSIPSIPILTKNSTPPMSPARGERSRKQSILRGSCSSPLLSSPARRQHVEGVYDRFLMATSGVKRVGRGYQSDNPGAILNVPSTRTKKRNTGLFNSVRRAMPPPVSSDDLVQSVSVDEYGVMEMIPISGGPQKTDGHNTVRLMKNALKAIVTVRPTSRHPSRVF